MLSFFQFLGRFLGLIAHLLLRLLNHWPSICWESGTGAGGAAKANGYHHDWRTVCWIYVSFERLSEGSSAVIGGREGRAEDWTTSCSTRRTTENIMCWIINFHPVPVCQRSPTHVRRPHNYRVDLIRTPPTYGLQNSVISSYTSILRFFPAIEANKWIFVSL